MSTLRGISMDMGGYNVIYIIEKGSIMISSTPTAPQPDPGQRITRLEEELAAMQQRLALLETNSLHLDKIFQPWVGFASGCALALIFALFCFAMFKDQRLYYYLTYIVPITVPFIGFIFDRMERYFQNNSWFVLIPLIITDTVVTLVAITRAVYHIPFISGHALFLSFVLLTVRSWWVRIPVILVLLEVIYFKVWVWRDNTLYGGALFGVLAAGLWWGLKRRRG
jgi:hypothetical protein